MIDISTTDRDGADPVFSYERVVGIHMYIAMPTRLDIAVHSSM